MRHIFARQVSLHQIPHCTGSADIAPRGPIGIAIAFVMISLTLTEGTALLNGGEPEGRKQQVANSITINPAATEQLIMGDVYKSPAPRLNKLPRKTWNGSRGASSGRGDREEGRRTKSEPLTDAQTEPRSKSLEVLHIEEVAKFVSREGLFGVSRMTVPMPSPGHSDYRDTGPLARTERPGRSGTTLILPEEASPEPGNRGDVEIGWKLPAEMLFDFHLREQNLLASPAAFEHFRDRTPIDGFRAKGFNQFPDLAPSLNQRPKSGRETHAARWRIERLELMSLIRHDEPAVYVSEHLPQMRDLNKVPTRPPHPFETEALKKLLAGEDLISAATANEISMVGGLRAAQQCVECHGGQRGDLLGAFSYRLFRDPPLKGNDEPAG